MKVQLAISAALILALQVACVTGQATLLNTTFKAIIRCGDVRPSPSGRNVTMGAIVDQLGRPLLDSRGRPILSPYPDFTSYWNVSGGLIGIVQLEDANAPYQAFTLEQDRFGDLRATQIQYVNISAWESTVRPCAGSKTPWMTHMGGEEQTPDVRTYTTLLNTNNVSAIASNSEVRAIMNWKGIYLGSGNTTNDNALRNATRAIGATFIEANNSASYFNAFATQFKPYMIGHIFEINPTNLSFVKHVGMGRASWELGLVMPDNKTVYLSDDAAAGGFSKYIANTAGDMSKGTLYAAKFTQVNAVNSSAGNWTLSWIKLADIDNSIVEAAARRPLTEFNFNSIFISASLTNGSCPANFTRIDWTATECLRLNTSTPNVEMLAAGLETRRFIPFKGATAEMTKMEGLTFDSTKPDKLYMAISFQRLLMNPGRPAPPGQDDIRVQTNICGCTYALDMDKDYNAINMYPILCGQNYRINGTEWCNMTAPANPDNLDVMDGYGWLLISEDADAKETYRPQDLFWVYNLDTKQLVRIGASENDTEVTTGWFTQLNSWSYFTVNYQGAANSPIGYMGPWNLTGVRNVTFQTSGVTNISYLNPYAPWNGVAAPLPTPRRALLEDMAVHYRVRETVRTNRARRMSRRLARHM